MKKNLFLLTGIMFAAVVCFCSCTKSLQQIIEETEQATFVVYTYDEFGSPQGSGSGFFIESEGVGVTNYHVLDKSIKAVIKTTDEKQYEIDSVLLSSQQKDLLVFRIKNPDNRKFETLTFSKEKPQKGDKVYVIGAPVGLATSVSEGIVSSYRDNTQGETVQTTAAISPGSSGSPMLDDKGKVFAVASFKRKGAENVNFGVVADKDFRNQLDAKEFYKRNRKFNSAKTDFILLNILPDKGSDIVLNAIELGPTATTLYFTFTNMHLSADGTWMIWCEMGKKDKGFFIEDRDTKKRYYVTSSTLETEKSKSTPVELANIVQFKVNFPAIKDHLTNIDVMWGEDGRSSHFTNIDLDEYRNNLSVDELGYQRAYALKYTTEAGNYVATMSMLTDLLDENPSDVISLNMMAILSYLIDNKTDAMYYFSEAIDQNPNDELAYVNLAELYIFEKNYNEAIEKYTSAINLCPEQPDYYYFRAITYYQIKDYQKGLNDINKCMEVSSEEDGFKDSPYLYEWRAWMYYYLNNKSAAQKDVQKAFKLSTDRELDERLRNFYEYYL